ncbi:MAG: ABC transporter ATP-binding protein, partial [Clostridia bacterium]|nr:ABC transporter ATP-binding protein [Clostridia bacterium]
MLEVKNLVKEYRPKKGNPVRAVDGISLKFPEKGMVFILGKSGSGKSTLLNLLGGLDKYDSGEIIIKGKSSKDFSQSEFDSYRNTYLGFIFQEYNILNDFNVAQNIAIALQLQGQKATSERINEILKEVDLDGYGGRKPSELSGGQKQRVAIARALVKNPEIIMADEPTGALDSKTGLQVFDTLKKLSQDKLVIVITHDRDFAEMYGDRVIELKDGKVISDVEKYTASAKEVSEGIKVTDDKVISVRKGYVLTEKDLDMINGYLKDHEMIISVDDKANGDLKRFARINDEGEKESFRQTDESKIQVSDDKKFRLIKSRLPLKNMIVIGASGLKNKPIRLIVTILLSLVAFTMFGLTDTLAAYNKVKATEKSIEESGISEIALVKKETHTRSNEYGDWTETFYSNYSDKEIEELNQKTGMDFHPVLEIKGASGLTIYLEESPKDNYYSHDFGRVLEVDEAYISRMGLSYEGTLPKEENEVAISKFYYDAFDEYGYKYGEKTIPADSINSPTDFLSKNPSLNIDGQEYKITAVIETNFDGNKYSSLKSSNQSMDINIT